MKARVDMTTDASKKSGYIPGLNGIRAFALFAVIAYHLNLEAVSGGFLGVGVFFVLSGYLITDLLMMEWKYTNRIDFRQFWIRRIKRLLPTQLVVLLAVALWTALFHPLQLAELWGDWFASLFYMTNWWFIFNDIGYFSNFGQPSPLLHFWSLAVEEQFYLVWPVLLLLGLRFVRNRKLLTGFILFGALASIVGMAALYQPGLLDTSRVYFGTDTRAFSLLIGAALALCVPSHIVKEKLTDRKGARLALNFIGTVSLAGLLWMMWKTTEYDAFLYRGGMVLQSLAAAGLIVAAVHPSTWINRVFEWKWLRWFGIRSYGIYLWHYPIIVLFFPAGNGENRLIWMLIQMGITLVVATLSWRFIEQPIRYGAKRRKWRELTPSQ
ncbi:acyltransferase [Alkalihalobacillus oceani]|uniref:Acyltransferase n=1 Tax=Halalkalibacter oceani TaxID=1653776 RepID=A0A9X2DQ72_9BACI|nr:acyltransferase [Halalkalibacter oceani]MCM3713860.1 acyltransferase [Halalkalibacter oceani]